MARFFVISRNKQLLISLFICDSWLLIRLYFPGGGSICYVTRVTIRIHHHQLVPFCIYLFHSFYDVLP